MAALPAAQDVDREAGERDDPFVGPAQFRFVAAAYERRSLGIGSHWPFESWGRFLPEHTTAASLLDRLLHHANVIVMGGTQSCN